MHNNVDSNVVYNIATCLWVHTYITQLEKSNYQGSHSELMFLLREKVTLFANIMKFFDTLDDDNLFDFLLQPYTGEDVFNFSTSCVKLKMIKIIKSENKIVNVQIYLYALKIELERN